MIKKMSINFSFAALAVLSIFIISACTSAPQKDTVPNQQTVPDDPYTGILLVYSERDDAGGEIFRNRVFISSSYLLMKDERFGDDILLFNRDEQAIYTVNSMDKSIFVIRSSPIDIESPIKIDYVEEAQPSAAISTPGGPNATHYKYMANGSHCYDAVVLDKTFMPDVRQALIEFRSVLAGEHAKTVLQMPSDTHDACDLAINIFHAAQHLQNGLPIREWDQRGRLRFMVDYPVKFKIDPEQLKLPADYKRYSIDVNE